MEEQEFLDENDPILNQIWDEIQQREIGEVAQFEENRTLISGLEIKRLLFKQTRDETKATEIKASNVYADSPPPLPETLDRLEGLVKDCIADWVAVDDLKLVKGDLEQDFDTCQFPAKDMFLPAVSKCSSSSGSWLPRCLFWCSAFTRKIFSRCVL